MLETRSNSQTQNKILAIEDDPEVLALYKSFLQKRGYEVLSATGAIEALESTLVSVLENRPRDCEVIVVSNRKYDDPYSLAGEVTFIEADRRSSSQ